MTCWRCEQNQRPFYLDAFGRKAARSLGIRIEQCGYFSIDKVHATKIDNIDRLDDLVRGRLDDELESLEAMGLLR